jgi:hypothetical protein
MKSEIKKATAFTAFFILMVFISGSCIKDNCNRTIHYQVLTPVYKSLADLRSSFGVKPAMEINNPGKIYVYGKYLLVNELNKGIHVIDNSNPASPVKISFINIPGNVDLAVRDNILYADCAIDLLGIDISNPVNPVLVNRYENFFKNLNNYDPSNGVIVDYKTEQKTETYSECNPNHGSIFTQGGVYLMDAKGGITAASTSGGPNPTVGVGGSMAKFTIVGNYLYGVDNSSIYCVNVSNASHPSIETTLTINSMPESIFPFNGKLFIGGATGIQIYSLINPANPSIESDFGHVTSCDPVVADNKYAYITLHSGSPCHTHDDVNELDIADISDIHNPVNIKTIGFTHPLGLGIDNNILFLCDDQDGLKIYDATDPMTLADHSLAKFPINGAYDVIPLNNDLILTAKDGVYQFDYSDSHHIKMVSKIDVIRQ